jgi:hypothetical protein
MFNYLGCVDISLRNIELPSLNRIDWVAHCLPGSSITVRTSIHRDVEY